METREAFGEDALSYYLFSVDACVDAHDNWQYMLASGEYYSQSAVETRTIQSGAICKERRPRFSALLIRRKRSASDSGGALKISLFNRLESGSRSQTNSTQTASKRTNRKRKSTAQEKVRAVNFNGKNKTRYKYTQVPTFKPFIFHYSFRC